MVSLESNKLFQRPFAGGIGEIAEGDARTDVRRQPVHLQPGRSRRRHLFCQGRPGADFGGGRDGRFESAVKNSAGGIVRRNGGAGPGRAFGQRDGRAADDGLFHQPRPELLQILGTSPGLASALVREVIRRMRVFNDQYIREVFESERLALVGRFASSIVHDLKNPLNIIGISADMACMPTATPESRQVSKVRIRKQVERISNMVNELLEFTQGAHTNFVLAQMDYKTFVEQLIEEIQQEVALKSVKIEYVNRPPSVPVRINPQRLSRVFHNLIGNAADAMPGGGTIKVRFNVNGA